MPTQNLPKINSVQDFYPSKKRNKRDMPSPKTKSLPRNKALARAALSSPTLLVCPSLASTISPTGLRNGASLLGAKFPRRKRRTNKRPIYTEREATSSEDESEDENEDDEDIVTTKQIKHHAHDEPLDSNADEYTDSGATAIVGSIQVDEDFVSHAELNSIQESSELETDTRQWEQNHEANKILADILHFNQVSCR